jgi:hypothetical protein
MIGIKKFLDRKLIEREINKFWRENEN